MRQLEAFNLSRIFFKEVLSEDFDLVGLEIWTELLSGYYQCESELLYAGLSSLHSLIGLASVVYGSLDLIFVLYQG